MRSGRILFALITLASFAAFASGGPTGESTRLAEGEAANLVDSQQQQQPLHALPVRDFFRFPKLFHFAEFKRFFKKQYESLSEELQREKLFLARAFRAFISAIEYKRQQRDNYLAVNQLSDRTTKELESSLIQPEVASVVKREAVPDDNNQEKFFDARTSFDADDDDNEDQFYDAPSKFDDQPTGDEEFFDANENFEADEEGDVFYDAQPDFANSQNNSPKMNRPKRQAESPETQTQSRSGYLNSLKSIPFASYIPSAEKLKSMYHKASSMLYSSKPVEDLPASQLPDVIFVDHGRDGCLTEPRQQGTGCSSSYILAATSLYEFMNCAYSGNLTALSAQYPLDCGQGLDHLNGCKGGDASGVAEFAKLHGFELSKSYPYVGVKDRCPYNQRRQPDFMGLYRAGGVELTRISAQEIEQMHKLTPVYVTLSVDEDFFEYGGGVAKQLGCDRPDGNSLKQAMLLVGSGRENGEEFWLLRNSFSVFWGEQGYMKLSKKADCFNSPEIYVPAAQLGASWALIENVNYNSGPVDFKYSGFVENDFEDNLSKGPEETLTGSLD